MDINISYGHQLLVYITKTFLTKSRLIERSISESSTSTKNETSKWPNNSILPKDRVVTKTSNLTKNHLTSNRIIRLHAIKSRGVTWSIPSQQLFAWRTFWTNSPTTSSSLSLLLPELIKRLSRTWVCFI